MNIGRSRCQFDQKSQAAVNLHCLHFIRVVSQATSWVPTQKSINPSTLATARYFWFTGFTHLTWCITMKLTGPVQPWQSPNALHLDRKTVFLGQEFFLFFPQLSCFTYKENIWQILKTGKNIKKNLLHTFSCQRGMQTQRWTWKPRHCMVWSNLFIAIGFFPPHNFLISVGWVCLCTVTFYCLHEPLWSTMLTCAHALETVFIPTRNWQLSTKTKERKKKNSTGKKPRSGIASASSHNITLRLSVFEIPTSTVEKLEDF